VELEVEVEQQMIL
jgi:hypothetical protein